MTNNFNEKITLSLDIPKSASQINADIKKLQSRLNDVKASGSLDTRATVEQINAQISALQSQLKTVPIKADIDNGSAKNAGEKAGQEIANAVRKSISDTIIDFVKNNLFQTGKKASPAASTPSIRVNTPHLIERDDFSSLFPSTQDADAFFQSFNQNANHSIATLTQWCESFQVVDETMQAYLVDCIQNQMPASFEAYNEYVQSAIENNRQLGFSARASALVLQGFAAIGKSFAVALISQAIQTAITAIDNWIHRVERANDAMREAVSESESAKTSLENVNSKLYEQTQRINELLSKDKLTYTEKNELETLQAITKELLLQQNIEEKQAEKASKDAAQKAISAYQKQYGGYDISQDNINWLVENMDTPLPESENNIAGNIASYIHMTKLLEDAQKERENILANGQSTEWIDQNIQSSIESSERYSNLLNDSIADLNEKLLALDDEYTKAMEKWSQGANPLTSYEQEVIRFHDSMYQSLKLIYEYTNQKDWNEMEINAIFHTEGIEKTKEELMAMAEAGELTAGKIAFAFPMLHHAIQNSELLLKDGQTAAEAFCSELLEYANAASEIAPSFQLEDYAQEIDDIQSSLSSLRSALDSFNAGTLDENAILELMQQFPELIPYIDLSAEGFGNLSEGLSTLMEQQPDTLINTLETLKSSLQTEEECTQIDALINSLQSLSSYGDTGIEAYTASIGSTWADTANVIESTTAQFESLAQVQEAVAHGLTLSTSAAAELAKTYPEILTNAIDCGNGQITLNEEVVNSILAGDQSILDAQIAKLEADKAELTAKKAFAEAQLNMVKQVAEGEGSISMEVAQYRLDAANSLLHALIEAGLEEDKAYAAVAANMAGNMDEFNRVAGEVAQDIAINMGNASTSMADSISINSINAQTSFLYLQKKVWDVADAIKAASSGFRDGSDGTYGGGGSTNSIGIQVVKHAKDFKTSSIDYTPSSIDLDAFRSKLEIDIKGYTDAISNIDSQINILKNLKNNFQTGSSGQGYADKIKELEQEKENINTALDSAKKESSAVTKDDYQELVDFFERRNKVLSESFSLLKTNLDNIAGAYAKNQLATAQLGIVEEKFKNYSSALHMYSQKAGEALAKLPSHIADKAQNGAVDITTFTGSGNKGIVEAIKEYEKWADKIADCKQELAELKAQIRQLELDKFNNIMEDFQNQFDLHEDGKSLISKQIDLLKEAGQLIGESFFTSQIDQSQKQLALLEAEKAQLVSQMTSAVGSGRVQKGTEEWLEMVNALSDVESNILDCQKAMEELDNELLQLHWDIFDRIQKQFKNLESELSNLQGLFEGSQATDGNHNWSKEALAQLGLLAQQYELTQYQIQKYNDELNQLSSDYLSGKYSATEYADKLADLSSAQWESVKSSEAIKDAIIDLNEARINEEISAIDEEIDGYHELVDAQIKALKASKDLHDYQQSIAEKTKKVTDIERQIAAMQNDDTASATAKKKQLEEQLAEAKMELENAQYEHSIEEQSNSLNQELENYENERNAEIEKLKESLTEKEGLIAASFEAVKQNAALIGQEIANIATEHGITVSNAVITPWQTGEMAIASYGTVLSEGSSAFIESLLGIEYETYNLQYQANETAYALAWMFSTRADTLVAELASSYYSEQNLNEMTQALRDSLVRTLEGGYNISGISNALNGITGGLNNVASAARNAANAISSVGAAQQASSSSKSKTLYKLEGVAAGTITSYNKSDLEKLAKSYGKGTVVPVYAKGGIITKNSQNPFNHIAKALGEDTMIAAKEGESVLTSEQTGAVSNFASALLEAARKSQLLLPKAGNQFTARAMRISPALWNWNIPNQAAAQQAIVPNSVNRTNVNVHYDNMINIQGDVNDADRVVKQIENVAANAANKAIEKSWHDLDMTRKYGIY